MISKRNARAILQYARTHQLENRYELALRTLEKILPKLGDQSHSRVMVNRIGSLLLEESVSIIAPSCPDYSHEAGKYTFQTLRGGVPLLSQLHITFLETIVQEIENVTCEIVVANQEADEDALCKQVGMSHSEFLEKVLCSVEATQVFLKNHTWKVRCMTERFPTLRTLERTLQDEIDSDPRLQTQITTDTIARSLMYNRIGVFDTDSMRMRTIKTAAQYSALATLAVQEGLLICNHETVNLGWYNRHGAAVLHNPVSVY